jgi:hypothetical protein
MILVNKIYEIYNPFESISFESMGNIKFVIFKDKILIACLFECLNKSFYHLFFSTKETAKHHSI